MLSICLACQFDRLSCGVLVQVASSSRGFLPNLVGFVSLNSPFPRQDAEVPVPRSTACIEISCGCGQCIFLTCSCLPQPPNVGSGERFSVCQSISHVGFAPAEMCCFCKSPWQQFCLFSFFPVGFFCCRSQDCSLVLGNTFVCELMEEKRSFDCMFCELLKFTRLCMTTEDLTQKSSSPQEHLSKKSNGYKHPIEFLPLNVVLLSEASIHWRDVQHHALRTVQG